MDVAVAACRNFRGSAPTDLYPDPDWPALTAALARAGGGGIQVAWDDEEVDWGRFGTVVVRSTWDSVDRPDAYLAWARSTARLTNLWNPADAIAWNLDKRYLLALQSRGIAVVPTDWVVDDWMAPEGEFVVKPCISAGGRETARYRPGEAAAAGDHVRRLVATGRPAMVQPYVAGVDGEGETKVVFLDGAYSHAVRTGPLLERGTGVLERPWERPVSIEPVEATPAQQDAARRVLAAVEAEVHCPLLYARVDLVPGAHGEPLLAEVELIDPILFLRFVPPAADWLAAAIAARTPA